MGTERQFIQLACMASAQEARGLILANGDDAAVFAGQDRDWAISTDAFIEDIHFRRSYFSWEDLGAKAIEAASSDLIAVGANPTFCLISQSLPQGFQEEHARELWSGIRQACERLSMTIIGGDTCQSPRGVQLHVTVLGNLEGHAALSRASAQAGDLLMITGPLGASLRGFQICEGSLAASQSKQAQAAKEKFLRTQCRRDCLSLLRRHAHATIDISDGLGKELALICAASHVGASVQSCNIPTFAFPEQPVTREELLSSGEEYEILFTAPPSRIFLQPGQNMEIDGIRVWCIGICEQGGEIVLDGEPLGSFGFEHVW